LRTYADYMQWRIQKLCKGEEDNVAYQSHRHIANAHNEILGFYACFYEKMLFTGKMLRSLEGGAAGH